MTVEDQVLLELTAWRENRQGGESGMQSVMNVILNRARRQEESIYDICTDPEQFSSITAHEDLELGLWPKKKNASDWAAWLVAKELALEAQAGTLADITGSAVLYYAPARIEKGANITLPDGTMIPFPKSWNPHVVEYTRTIRGQVFFK